MKVPGIEEICRTFGDAAYYAHKWDGIPELSQSMYRAGLLAVFETHVKGMLRDAYLEGADANLKGLRENPVRRAQEHVARTLSQLKEPRHD